jgi:hypothetical protein
MRVSARKHQLSGVIFSYDSASYQAILELHFVLNGQEKPQTRLNKEHLLEHSINTLDQRKPTARSVVMSAPNLMRRRPRQPTHLDSKPFATMFEGNPSNTFHIEANFGDTNSASREQLISQCRLANTRSASCKSRTDHVLNILWSILRRRPFFPANVPC